MIIDKSVYIGLAYKEAIKLAVKNGVKHRLACKDGESYMLTQELKPDRINFTIVDGVVISAEIG